MIHLSVLGCFCVFLLASHDGVSGNSCATKQMSCAGDVSDAASAVGSLVQARPVNVSAITQQCGTVRERIKQCQDDLKQLCPAGSNVDNIIGTLQSGIDSLCSPETVCSIRIQECNIDPTSISEITDAMRETPPNVEVIQEKCSELTRSSGSCLDRLSAECSNVSSVSSALSSLKVSLDSLCGKTVMCQIQMSRCQAAFIDMGKQDSQDHQEGMAKLCKAMDSAKTCFDTEMDSECRSLPQIQEQLNATLNNPGAFMCGTRGSGSGGSSMTCQQAFQCTTNIDIGGNCSLSRNPVHCILGLRDACTLEESKVTFKELETVYTNLCQEISSAPSPTEYRDCPALTKCIMNSEISKDMLTFGMGGANAQQMKELNQRLLSSQTWCELLEIVTNCHVSNADSCNYDTDFVTAFRMKNQQLRDSCGITGVASCHGASYTTLLIVLAVFFSGRVL